MSRAERLQNPEAFKNPFEGQNILSVEQFTRENLDNFLFPLTDWMRAWVKEKRKNREALELAKGLTLATVFYEPSSRTRISFEQAMRLIGGNVESVGDVRRTSSVAKGENLPDSTRIITGYAMDAIVLRHPEVGSAQKAAEFSPVPIINAGDGTGEHPTQALLDAYTIEERLGRLENLTVILGGDLENGRTVHSLSRLLALYPGNRLVLVSPQELKMPRELIAELSKKGVETYESENLEDVIGEADVAYWTRIQKERFEERYERKILHALSQDKDLQPLVESFQKDDEKIVDAVKTQAGHQAQAAYDRLYTRYIITPEVMDLAKPEMILMHPLPRVNEISMEVDSDPRAVYFEQAENGLYVRMALLAAVLGRLPPEFSS